ncbi:hypothetical protein [Actinobacillus pleuropneumoniae]|nr:hypothetical protein [Actinobacillus pleuropneumoniae]CUU51630.1 hypothetical protein MIDG2331_00324 [Actinobacillus pleuropneumoniae serovar 8]
MNYEFIGLLLIASCALIYFSHYLKKEADRISKLRGQSKEH